jgi:hypothetical protein
MMYYLNSEYQESSFKHVTSLKTINGVPYIITFHIPSLKSHVWFTVTAHLNSDHFHFRCSIATHSWWPPCWKVQVYKMARHKGASSSLLW